MVRRFSWNVFAICIVLILSLTLSTVSPILYFVIGNKQEEQISTAPNWFDGKGLPSSAMGSDGDYYLDTLNGNVYQKKDSVWEVIYGIGKGDKGEQGPAGKDGNAVKTGTGDPNTSHVKGSTGDLYLDTQSGDLYEMQSSGNWLYEANIKGSKGDKGQDGATWQVGDKDPRQSQSGVEGKEGDFYLNSSTWDLYKKTASGWSWVGNIQGEVGKQGLSGKDGATWIVGTDDPDGKVKGNSGDLYLNTLTYEVYKCSGETSWSSVGNIKGIAGPKGDDGQDGKDGTKWYFGNGTPQSQPSLSDVNEGDFYLDQTGMHIYRYESSEWQDKGAIRGEDGEDGQAGKDGSKWTSGTGSPNGRDTGSEGDFYLDSESGTVYKCNGGTVWEESGTIKGKDGENGQNGKDGTKWYFDKGSPEDKELSPNEGDYYLDETNFEIYRYEGSSWKDVGSIKGTQGEQGPSGAQGDKGIDGATWKLGTSSPDGKESGNIGDLYLDTSDWTIYRNTDGEQKWTSVGSIKGPDGVQGPAGQTGKDGATWKVGEQDPNESESGNAGDLYLNKKDWTVYECNGGTSWTPLGSIRGNDGKDGLNGSNGTNGKDGATWQVGTADPTQPESGVSGKVGDLYLNTNDWNVYRCTDDENNWGIVGSIIGKTGERGPAGEKGDRGATWFFGEGKPDEKELPDKKNGDFYLDTKDDCFDVWKYETEQWTRVGSIKGAQGDPGTPGTPGTDGATWQVGTQNPLNDEIANSKEGDFYLNTNDWNLYRKGSSGWTFVVCIKGQDGEDGQKGDDGQAGKDADDVYMGYDGYIWRGAERSDWYIPGATAGEDVFEHTTEVAEVMSKYFTHDYVDLSTNVIALMPYYKEHVDQTLYSGMELTEITVYAKEEGKLQIGSAKVKDVIDSRTNGTDLLIINEHNLQVKKGKNIIKHTLHIDDDETIVLGGNGSVSLYYAKDIPVDDEPGNFAVIDKQSHAELLEKTGTKYNDTLAIQVRMSLTVDVPIFEDLRQHVEEDIEGGLDGLESPVRFGDEHWGAYMYAYTGQNTNLFEGKTITRIGVPLEELNRSEGGGLPYLDMYLIPTYKDENGVTPDPDSKDVIAKRKEHSILTNNILTDRLEIKSESEYQAEQKELEKGATWVDFDCRYVVPDGYTLAFCGDGGGFKWLLVHSNGSDSEVEKLGLNKIPYYTPMNTIIGLGKNKDSGSSDYTKYSGNTETFKLLFDIYYEVEWSPAEQIARLEELEWEATEMDRLRSKVGDKYISILGDSISTYDDYSNDYTTQNKDIKDNNGGEGNATAYPRLAEISVEDTWWKRTINQAGLKLCVNNSSAGDLVMAEGSRIGYGSGRSAQLHDNTTKYDSDPTIASKNQDQEEDIYPDIVAIYFGINDFTNHIADEDGGVKEFETNYKLIVNKIMDTYGSRKENFKLFVFTLFPEEGVSKDNHPTLDKFPVEENYQAALDKYNTVIRSIALDNRKIEVVDLSRKYHLSRDEFKPYALQDSLHPNERGMRLMSNAFLEELYRVYVGK